MARERSKGPFEQIGETVGGAVGRAAGRANDMAMSAVGNVFGSALRRLGPWWSTPDAERASASFGERADRACRTHWESSRSGAGGRATHAAHGYEHARPAYQFGYVAGRNPEYQSRPFDQVEAEIERAWEKVGREHHGDWSEVRDRVGFGYTYREPEAPDPT